MIHQADYGEQPVCASGVRLEVQMVQAKHLKPRRLHYRLRFMDMQIQNLMFSPLDFYFILGGLFITIAWFFHF